MYRPRILPTAIRELEKPDKPLARRVIGRIRRLAADPNDTRPEAYKGEFTGLYKLRIGDYRIIYEILHDERTIVIHQVGHRSDLYRKR